MGKSMRKGRTDSELLVQVVIGTGVKTGREKG